MRRIFAILFINLALAAAPPDEAVSRGAIAQLREARAGLGLEAADDFVPRDVVRDGLGQVHVRLQQTYRGLPVWGGQAIVHVVPSGEAPPMTDALVRGVRVEPTPNLGPREALAVAQDRIAPRGPYADPPRAELVVWPETAFPGTPAAGQAPDATDPAAAPVVVAHRLAYHLHAALENGPGETRHEDLLLDAHTGAVLKAWSTLFTARRKSRAIPAGRPERGVGLSQYSGKVPLHTMRAKGGFELTDPTRGGLATRNLAGATSGSGEPYVNASRTWGDGQNYDPGRGPGSPNGQTAAVDAHYGLQTAWDFYHRILGRDGLDGKGTAPVNYVHYAEGFDNAFWSDACFCMTYGDGLRMGTLTSLDVVGHEVSHGLCTATAGLAYEGESGGLNEANSDIFGVMIRFYAREAGGLGSRVPEGAGPWTVGGDLADEPFRHLDRPSLDGHSPDEWSPALKDLDPHLSSGPMNRAFYFLAQGASADPTSPAHSRWLPEGMEGIGNDKALRIWWRTLSTRLTPTSGYRQARAGALQSARELYGDGGPEMQAVGKAFRAIHVGRRKH
ncbi:M4 family metallopeptidase [Mesoterricola silvestris]|uniref:Neutral metalloproteinase n=1 Tax=Mesoterricola silvestris TaxID=2927979 RepID=A0AA48K8G0_9BACT|nr:M4 family metallopeptidase [Mesoterricola silvestris]BDU72874.1 peptidase [Mesoterricola silvestris]